MKHTYSIASVIALLALTSCAGFWASTDDSGSYYDPGTVSLNIGNSWYPYPPYDYGPYGWNGNLYPGPALPPQPLYRPEYRPGPGPVTENRPVGNYRPGPSSPGTPIIQGPATTLPDNRPIIERPSGPSTGGNTRPPQLNGSNPGIALPPAGTGYRTTSQGRH